MNFIEALEVLKDGKKITRKTFGSSPDKFRYYTTEDFEADDWEVVE
ncbi:DUF2829 domain-containing protein (plasmid) [Candidatus Trichorickettsia mobilis]|uniref:DUF2829 domain-containing protein n=1 Tax=Candidatus Trichorickettsia mobilis TaxID=1346319 RepID=A0ABZ0UX52_9RICK|nr:hypothetical protein [Candidatus Trichorickettsia mobilis]WPY01509.1 DUF2829 domain-containing protein [Candidatus Trichorickettsia mobilis]